MCVKFECNCIIQPEKRCLFCTYKTWAEPVNKLKKNLESLDEVDYGDGDNAISFEDLLLKVENEEKHATPH